MMMKLKHGWIAFTHYWVWDGSGLKPRYGLTNLGAGMKLGLRIVTSTQYKVGGASFNDPLMVFFKVIRQCIPTLPIFQHKSSHYVRTKILHIFNTPPP